MGKRPKTFRREILVYPRFQLYLVFINCFILMAMGCFLAWVANQAFSEIDRFGTQMHLYKGHPLFSLINLESQHFFSTLIVVLGGSILLSSWAIISVSHRAVGPLCHLRAYLKQIVSREKAPRTNLRFRKNDFFDDLPAMVNGAVSVLRSGAEEDDQNTNIFRKAKYNY